MEFDKLKQQKMNYYNKNKDTINKTRRERYAEYNNSVKGVHQLPITNNTDYEKYFTYNEAMKKDDYLDAVKNNTFERQADFPTQKSKIYNTRYTECQQRDDYSLNIKNLKPNESDKINKPYGLSKLLNEPPAPWAVAGHTFSHNMDFGPNGHAAI